MDFQSFQAFSSIRVILVISLASILSLNKPSSNNHNSQSPKPYSLASLLQKPSASDKQPRLATMGAPLQDYYFEITNPSNKSIELGRISLATGIKGVVLTGGVNSNTVQIARVVDGGMIYGTNFELVSNDLSKLVFDASSPISVRGKSVAKFALLMNLDDSAGNPDSDYVYAKILSDAGSAKGTFTDLRSIGYNFIWSDVTASPHSENSRDWISGYLLSGLPTNVEFSKR